MDKDAEHEKSEQGNPSAPTIEALETYRAQLLSLARRNLNPILSRRIAPEDVVQDVFASACQRVAFFEGHPEIPTYFKLRTLLFQTLADLERKHLQSQKRDAYKEIAPVTENVTQFEQEHFVDGASGPLTQVAQGDRHALLQRALASLPEKDRRILELRHFDGLSNSESATILSISPKNASIRYVRALERLQRKLLELSEFRP